MYILGLGFYLAVPTFICKDGSRCSASRACEEGDYSFASDSVHSLVYEWKLVCDQQYQVSVIGTCYFLGVTVGSLLISTFADGYGRQRTCLCASLLLGSALLAAAFAPWVLVVDLVTAVAGFAETTLTASVFLLLNESVPSELRSWYSGLSFVFWSAGTMMDALLFYTLPGWREVMLVSAVIAFASAIGLMRSHESVRWLVVNRKDFSAGLAVLRKTAKANKLDPRSITLPPCADAQREEDSVHSGFGGLLRSKELRRRALFVTVLWTTTTLCYYGLVICLSSYSGNIYENGVALSVGELSINLFVGRYMDRFPRRKGFIVSEAIAVLACTGAWLAGSQPTLGLLSVTGLLLAMGATNTLFLMVYIYTAELFPTTVRAVGYALTSSASRVGGLLASNLLLLETYTSAPPLLIMAAAMLFSVLPSLCLPETLGQPLLDYGGQT